MKLVNNMIIYLLTFCERPVSYDRKDFIRITVATHYDITRHAEANFIFFL